LPIAAAAAAGLQTRGAAPGRIPFALFWLAATLALVTFSIRNDQVYNKLIGRAEAIESELRALTGPLHRGPARGPR